VKASSSPDQKPESEAVPEQFLADDQLELLRGLAQIVERENLSELELEDGDVHLTLRSASSLSPPPASPGVEPTIMTIVETAPTPAPETPETEQFMSIDAPMVGVFFRSPSPSDPPFVEVGDHIEIGQTVGIIEAMKVFNEITSEVEGHIEKLVAGNAELVETGATLILIRQ